VRFPPFFLTQKPVERFKASELYLAHPLSDFLLDALTSWPLANNRAGDAHAQLSERARRQTVFWFWVRALFLVCIQPWKTFQLFRKMKHFLHLDRMKRHYLHLVSAQELKNDPWLASHHVIAKKVLTDLHFTYRWSTTKTEKVIRTIKVETMWEHPTDTYRLVYATRVMTYGQEMSVALNSLGK